MVGALLRVADEGAVEAEDELRVGQGRDEREHRPDPAEGGSGRPPVGSAPGHDPLVRGLYPPVPGSRYPAGSPTRAASIACTRSSPSPGNDAPVARQ